jgi:hypothetical protein
VADLHDAVVHMRESQETGRCRHYLGLPCLLRFHEDGWRPMAVAKRVEGLDLENDLWAAMREHPV